MLKGMKQLVLTFLLLSGFGLAQTPAPEFQVSGEWFNSEPLSIQDLRGQVVLVEMWTFGCYNCYRSIPELKTIYDTYKEQGFEIVGVHRPEFAYEKDAENVAAALSEHDVDWPVFQDNDSETWRSYKTRAWPSFYLIDAEGIIRYTHVGEISEKFPAGLEPSTQAIEGLLAETE